MSMTSSATPARNRPVAGLARVVSCAGSALCRSPWINMMISETPTTMAVACINRVDPPVAEDADHHRGDGQQQDPLRDAQRAGNPGHRLGLDDQLGGNEPDVEQQDAREQERRSVEPELAPALDRLWHPEPGALGGVKRDQQRPDERPGGDRGQRPPERQPDRDGHRAQDDVKHVDVAAPPERELVPRLAVPRSGRDVIDVPVLHVPAQLIVPRRRYSHVCSP